MKQVRKLRRYARLEQLLQRTLRFVPFAVLFVGGCDSVVTPVASSHTTGNGAVEETDSRRDETAASAKVDPGTPLVESRFEDVLARTGAKWIVVQVFAESCGPCITEAIALSERLDDWRRRGIGVIGLGMDETPESARAFFRQTGNRVRFPLYSASWFAEQQDVVVTPTLFVFDQNGTQLFRADGEDYPEGLLEALEAKLKSIARH